MARYLITHHTHYEYSSQVSLSQQLLHMQPRTLPWQVVEACDLDIRPRPRQLQQQADAFGNPCQSLEISQPHGELAITSTLIVAVNTRKWPAADASPPWETVVRSCRYQGRPLADDGHLEAMLFRQESPHVRIKHDFADWAAICFPPGQPLLVAARALMEKIHDEFHFDSKATEVGTPLLQVLQDKRGVCQDFAHLMIACLRSRGLPARYVSGYLLTQPPPGQPRLVGADASHAWVAVWCPLQGWVDFDPTNRVQPGEQHITVAWGRDFSDVSPLRGVIVGGGAHELTVEVTVQPLD